MPPGRWHILIARATQRAGIDVVVVAQGENLEASVLSTLLLKKLKVPWVVAKAKTTLHGELLNKVGADRVVFPEMDAGIRLAHSLGVRHITDYITLSNTAGVAKIEAPANLVGHSIESLMKDMAGRLTLLIAGSQLITVPHFQEETGPRRVGHYRADIDIAQFVGNNPTPDGGANRRAIASRRPGNRSYVGDSMRGR